MRKHQGFGRNRKGVNVHVRTVVADPIRHRPHDDFVLHGTAEKIRRAGQELSLLE
ncbi:hypothetical protein [Thiothrix eikelboomii]|uniref:hypothetical protein n=1 Tax=Thiothrix eikelboomii TaxID=92487 RepID=UPI003BAFB888